MNPTRIQLSRRTLLSGLAGTAGAVALTGKLATPAEAKAPMLGDARPTHYRFKRGNFELTTVLDGTVNVPQVHPFFGQNEKADAVKAHMEQNHLPGDKLLVPFTPTVVNTGNELVLIDAGNGVGGNDKGTGFLTERLKAAGIMPDQVDVVAITHCHPDHIGGLVEGGKPVFPNARYVCGQAEYDFWSKKEHLESSDKEMASRAKLIQANVVAFADKMTFIQPGDDVVSGITSVGCFGHTPGHMAYHIESGGERLLVWGDIANHYVASVQKPEWHFVFDMDKEAAIASRKKVLSMVAADKIPAIGYHMPSPAAGFVEQVGDGFRWLQASYQLDL